VARKHVQGVINQALLAHEPCGQEADRSRSEPNKQAGTDTNEPAIMRKCVLKFRLHDLQNEVRTTTFVEGYELTQRLG
jgi:hypothetical protein